ncbi:MAG: branched-chain amino acid transporter permease protein [Chloroflexi bacterium]|nr:branched-chain amino acid transporter permease protein [Chloroflexota bacterium]
MTALAIWATTTQPPLSVVSQATGQPFSWTIFLQSVINGISFGSIYALLAMGIVLIYKSSDVVNFAQGQMAMFLTYIAYSGMGLILGINFLQPHADLPARVGWGVFLGAIALSLVVAALMGMAIEKFMLRPLARSSVLSQVLATIGAGTLLYGLVSWIWKAEIRPFPRFEAVAGRPVQLGTPPDSIIITLEAINFLVVGLILSFLLYLFFRFTMVGTALRAMAQNAFAARLMGINVGRLNGLAWALSLMLSAIAGVLAGPRLQLEPNMMTDVGVKAFAAAVLGGMTSLPGALLGGLVIGIIDNLAGYYLGNGLQASIAFLIIILVLVIRPNGLLGKTIRKKV